MENDNCMADEHITRCEPDWRTDVPKQNLLDAFLSSKTENSNRNPAPVEAQPNIFPQALKPSDRPKVLPLFEITDDGKPAKPSYQHDCLMVDKTDKGRPKEAQAQDYLRNGNYDGLKRLLQDLRKDGDIDAEGKFIKDVEERTGVKISFNGKVMELKCSLGPNANDADKGIGLTIDEKGKVTAWNYQRSFGVTERTPASTFDVQTAMERQVLKNSIDYMLRPAKK